MNGIKFVLFSIFLVLFALFVALMTENEIEGLYWLIAAVAMLSGVYGLFSKKD